MMKRTLKPLTFYAAAYAILHTLKLVNRLYTAFTGKASFTLMVFHTAVLFGYGKLLYHELLGMDFGFVYP